MEREDKDKELELLCDSYQAAPLAMCVDYRGMNVAEITSFRKQLREVGASAKVVKNTLAKISAQRVLKDGAEAADLDRFLGLFQGPSCVIFSGEDVVASAKVVAKAKKDFEDLEIKGGWYEGSFLDQKGVDTVASMPSREETLGKLLNLINTPATQLVRVLNAPGQQMVQVLSAYRDTLS
ncbi:MAG: 50S ribosomal protein L10 [Bdellovibrionales bacterium]|nr:50S ribosomal protein L10 [Bdellovibrionales bacterium]